MFFQGTTDQSAQEAAANAASQTYTKFAAIQQEFKEILGTLTSVNGVLGAVTEAFQELGLEAEELNKNFLQGRQRLEEMMSVINESAPGVIKLGGGYSDIRKTIAEIAAGTRTQTIATQEQVEELFAASKVLGTGVKDIVDSFDRVGFSYDKIAENLSESIVYVQNVGQNARAVMKDVLSNTDQLSRFTFENGVKGLTKMAAQASMMRFDMGKTFQFAENVLDPEKAVEVASAFQRLGVSVGNLTDPFSLMNQSITDPSGLQTSLINITKQFTYFDSEAKQFRINPQGILTLRELAPTIGMSAEELRKTALAAADMDSKLAKINTRGFNLNVSEEDKMLVANIATMGKEGEYEVKIRDEQGNEYVKKLTELQETDFQQLLEQQKQAPKSIQEIQQKQLNTAETMLAELRGIQQTMKTAFFGLPGMVQNVAQGLNLTRDVSKVLDNTLKSAGFQSTMENYKREIETVQARTDLSPKKKQEEINKLYESFKTDATNTAKLALNNSGIMLKSTLQQQDQQVKKLTEGVMGYFEKLLGGEEGKKLMKTRQQAGTLNTPQVGGIDYNILSTNAANPNASATLTGALSLGGKGNVVMNNPVFQNTYSPTVQPTLGGISTPQDFIDLLNKGGVQLSEQMARNVFESLKKLDVSTKAA